MKFGGAPQLIEAASLGTALARAGLLSSTNILLLESYIKRWNTSWYDAILSTQILSDIGLADAVASLLSLRRVHHLDSAEVEPKILQRLPFVVAYHLEMLILPTDAVEGMTGLRVLVVDPTRVDRWVEFSTYCKVPFRAEVIERRLMRQWLLDYYPISVQLPGLMVSEVSP